MSGALLGGAGAVALRARLLGRQLSCVDLARSFLESVGDDPLHAWATVDAELVLAHARRLDELSPDRAMTLPLFGIPIAIKDNFDTRDLATAYGSAIYRDHRPDRDAVAVSRLRQAGALIVGKTRCAEFAWMTPPETLNPIDARRTPGGSSNGSAAAVAAGTVPLATGTQTAGSIIRPGAYCGVLGYKPTFGRFPREGVKLLSPTLDTVGLFARDAADLRMAGAALDFIGQGQVRIEDGGRLRGSARRPRLGWARTPLWDQVEPEAAGAIDAWITAAREAGDSIVDLELPGYAALVQAQTTIQLYESGRALSGELASAPTLMSSALREGVGLGLAIAEDEYQAARRKTAELGPPLVRCLRGFDGVLTPGALGVPPLGLAFTGDPVFCRVWTLIGAPSVSLPTIFTEIGLPVPLQIVGAPATDPTLIEAVERLMVRQ